jgi:hypothetical protein
MSHQFSSFNIRCFKPGSMPPPDCFYILSKGLNTGRPSFTPNVNCFVFTCADPADLQKYYWLIYALWLGKKFHPYLCGSVVLFIHLQDLKKIVRDATFRVPDLEKVTIAMQHAIEIEKKLDTQLQSVRKLKSSLLQSFSI